MITLIKSIPIRVLIPLIILLGFLTFSIFQYYLERSRTFESIRNSFLISARVMGDNIQQVIEYFWVRNDVESIRKIVATYSAHPNVEKIFFTDIQGRVIVSSLREMEGSVFSDVQKEQGCILTEDKITCSFEVEDAERNENNLLIYFDIQNEIKKANFLLLEKLLGNILLMGFMSVLLYLFLQKLVVYDLNKVAEFIKRSEKGITRSNLKVEGKNEIEIIKMGINEAWETIWKLINKDHLTEIFNRRYLELVYETEMRNEPSSLFMALVDLDNFKDINDLFGHDFGDELLKGIARRLVEFAEQEGALAGRFGGDEFIFMGRVSDEQSLEDMMQNLRRAVSGKYEVYGTEVLVSVSVGYTAAEGNDKPSFYQLLKECDIALYKGKETTKDTVVFFNREQEVSQKKKMEILLELKKGLEKGEFYLFYQGIYDAETSEASAYEALLRWENAVLGYVPPGEFIPYAEASGFIVELGKYVIWQAMQASLKLGKPVHINLSARQLYDTRLIEFVEETCERVGCLKSNIIFEITETQNVMLDDHLVYQAMELMLRGYSVALDDFGTGYSNILLLNELKPSMIKIDMSIVRRLETDPDSVKIVKAILEIAETLGIEVVAEGVDSQLKVERLSSLGVKKMQGFYFEKPRRLEEILSLSKSS